MASPPTTKSGGLVVIGAYPQVVCVSGGPRVESRNGKRLGVNLISLHIDHYCPRGVGVTVMAYQFSYLQARPSE